MAGMAGVSQINYDFNLRFFCISGNRITPIRYITQLSISRDNLRCLGRNCRIIRGCRFIGNFLPLSRVPSGPVADGSRDYRDDCGKVLVVSDGKIWADRCCPFSKFSKLWIGQKLALDWKIYKRLKLRFDKS
jgi:hypothetical protein